MDTKQPEDIGEDGFPRIDRSVVTVGKLHDEPDEKAYWHARTPLERLEAVELYRQIAYGYDPVNDRIQRVVEVVKLPPR